MLIRSEYDIQFHLPAPLTILSMLRLHPCLDTALREPEKLKIEQIDLETKRELQATEYLDAFGNVYYRGVRAIPQTPFYMGYYYNWSTPINYYYTPYSHIAYLNTWRIG